MLNYYNYNIIEIQIIWINFIQNLLLCAFILFLSFRTNEKKHKNLNISKMYLFYFNMTSNVSKICN